MRKGNILPIVAMVMAIVAFGAVLTYAIHVQQLKNSLQLPDNDLHITTNLNQNFDTRPVETNHAYDGCVITGCGNRDCRDTAEVGILCPANELPEYMCYKNLRCEHQADGKCGWTKTAVFTACLEKYQTKGTNTNTSPTNSTADWKTYSNSEYGFSLQFPTTWNDYAVETKKSVTSKNFDGTSSTYDQVTFTPPSSGRTGTANFSILIASSNQPKPDTSINLKTQETNSYYWIRSNGAPLEMESLNNQIDSIVSTFTLSATADWKTYTNSKHNFSLQYPKGWLVSEKTSQILAGQSTTYDLVEFYSTVTTTNPTAGNIKPYVDITIYPRQGSETAEATYQRLIPTDLSGLTKTAGKVGGETSLQYRGFPGYQSSIGTFFSHLTDSFLVNSYDATDQSDLVLSTFSFSK